jgi:hypothetical protein
VHSQACSPCGALPLDIVMVLDRTGSMAGQKLVNAKQGVTPFLDDLDPAIDNVGLVVLHPAASVGTKCSSAPTSNSNPDERRTWSCRSHTTMRARREPEHELEPDLDAELRAGGRSDGLCQRTRRGPGRAQRERASRRPEGDHLPLGRRSEHGPGLPARDPAVPHEPLRPVGADRKRGQGGEDPDLLDPLRPRYLGAEACYAAPGANVGGTIAGNQNTPEMPFIRANQAMTQIATPGNYFYQPQPTQLVGVFDAITADLAKGTSRING